MIDPKNSDDLNDALSNPDNNETIHEISGDDTSIEYDKDRLEQADEASKPAYELNLDDETKNND